MNGNLVSLAMQYLTPEISLRIANALGIDRAVVEKAIAIAVPALLGILASNAAKAGGAERISGALKQFDSNVLPHSSQSFGLDQQGALIETGRTILSSVIGGSQTDALTQALSNFGNVNQSTATSLLSLAAPVVLGTLKSRSSNLDASRLADLLASQKANVAEALPSGMLSNLADSGVIEGLGAVKRSAGQVASSAAEAAQKAKPPTMQTKWLAWTIPLIALAAVLWYFFGQPTQKPTAPTATEVTQPLVVDGVDVSKEVTGVADQMKAALEGVTDAASAQTALPKLNETGTRLDKLAELIGKLTPDQKKIVAGLVASVLPALNTLADKVLAIAGVGDVLKPTIDGLRAKLEVLSKA